MPDQDRQTEAKPTRKGSTPLKVYCLPSEREKIAGNAKAVGLTVSSYLLNVGIGYEIKSTLDSQLVGELVKVNADLGRLGGLLKLWLTDDKKLAAGGHALTESTVRALLKRIEDTQAVMYESVKKL
ncbi:conjugal transfer transcriptional regulator TraJ [Pseudomonas syringae]|uniref:conjugal transfer transcriptional regulator TraJ n=1 Tax=Pseudomonas syringae TaxID=317 RepID=UPI00200A95A3|nr:conjugal transfer transcriptional regulator TraJ [Pseudomonas syringae]MCK9709860.1 conjugal transfer transcriptional regulator TraJ [Pseudomonas syringae pv. syringae]